MIVIVWKFLPVTRWFHSPELTNTLITVKNSLNPSDEEEMTCSALQMRHNLKNNPSVADLVINLFLPVPVGDTGKQEQLVSRTPPGMFLRRCGTVQAGSSMKQCLSQ